ncbi:hypothetical protein [Lactobacillus helveticus]|uniref:hypothetical protein n=1 Tax=Lactobacillus helveticus TaxID=1587 RepID=UPI00156291AD|nr:hypothetical protein [Lactobacillus helveticus]NRO27722.1 hypothetical protein [Lactobacillus helveticus]
MHGKIIQFKADIANFKVKDGVVNIQLTADTHDIVLDQLNDAARRIHDLEEFNARK